MGAVFSYSPAAPLPRTHSRQFQSLMGAVFSYSLRIVPPRTHQTHVSIPDGCSVQL